MCPLVCGIASSVPINDPRQNLDWSVWHSDIASGKSSSINSHVLRVVLWLASLPTVRVFGCATYSLQLKYSG